MKNETIVKIFFILLASIILLFSSSKITTVNQTSFFLPAESIVQRGTFAIDNGQALTSDKIKVAEHFYSSKPPVPYVLAAMIYYPLYNYAHLQFPNHESYYFRPNILVYIYTVIFVGLPSFLLALYFYKTLLLLKVESKKSILLSSGLIFSTLCFSYALSFNRHMVPAMAFYVGFYYLLLNKIEKQRWQNFILSGLFFSLGAVFDLPIGFLLLALYAIYILYKYNLRSLALFGGSALVLLVIHFYLNFLIIGDILPIQLHKNLYLYTGSYWLNPDIVDQPENNPLIYIFNILFGSKGFFLYSPLLILSFAGIIGILKKRKNLLFEEAIIFLTSFLILVFYYTFFIKIYPGVAIGYRWFLPIIPSAYLFIYVFFINHVDNTMKKIFFYLWITGFFINALFAANPWV